MTKTLTHEISVAEAEQRTADHKRDFARLERGWVRLGRDVEESVRLGVPAKLGKTMRAWLEDTFPGTSASHIFRQLRSYRELQGVDEATLLAIPEANAHELTRLSEKDRKDPQIVSQAVSQGGKEFKKTVEKIRAEKYGITPDEWQTYARRVPQAVFDLMLAAEGKMAAVLELNISEKFKDEDFSKWTGNMVKVLEAQAQMILSTDEARLKVETEGQ